MDQEKSRPKTIGHRLDQKLETVRKNYRTVTKESEKQMSNLQSQTRSKRQLLKKVEVNSELLRLRSRKSKKSTGMSRDKEKSLAKKERRFVQRMPRSRIFSSKN